jgi:hypothetical protein
VWVSFSSARGEPSSVREPVEPQSNPSDKLRMNGHIHFYEDFPLHALLFASLLISTQSPRINASFSFGSILSFDVRK